MCIRDRLKTISASIIQGSAIGPASYVVDASDLQAVTDGNALCKYADDTYLIIPASTSTHVLPSYITLKSAHLLIT